MRQLCQRLEALPVLRRPLAEVGGGGRLVEEDEGEDGGEGGLEREEGGDERRARPLVRVRLRRVVEGGREQEVSTKCLGSV